MSKLNDLYMEIARELAYKDPQMLRVVIGWTPLTEPIGKTIIRGNEKLRPVIYWTIEELIKWAYCRQVLEMGERRWSGLGAFAAYISDVSRLMEGKELPNVKSVAVIKAEYRDGDIDVHLNDSDPIKVNKKEVNELIHKLAMIHKFGEEEDDRGAKKRDTGGEGNNEAGEEGGGGE